MSDGRCSRRSVPCTTIALDRFPANGIQGGRSSAMISIGLRFSGVDPLGLDFRRDGRVALPTSGVPGAPRMEGRTQPLADREGRSFRWPRRNAHRRCRYNLQRQTVQISDRRAKWRGGRNAQPRNSIRGCSRHAAHGKRSHRMHNNARFDPKETRQISSRPAKNVGASVVSIYRRISLSERNQCDKPLYW